MSYRNAFDQTIQDVLAASALPDGDEFWPVLLSEEGVSFGQESDLDAPEAAAWYLSAAALIRMQEGALGAPATARILRSARRLADAHGLSPALRDALLRVEEERRSWVLENHEFQGAQLRALRPVSGVPEIFENRPFGRDLRDPRDGGWEAEPPPLSPSSVWDGPGYEHAVDDYPGTDWPGLLERLLDEESPTAG
jgi:hypothetical protein